MRKISLIFLGLFFTSIFTCYYLLQKKPQQISSYSLQSETYNSISKFTDILYEIKNSYYKNVNTQDLIGGAIKGMIENLDPYSGYLSKEQFENFTSYELGEFSGIGIEFFKNKNNAIEISKVINKSPAQKNGVVVGDYLTHINNNSIGLMKEEEISKALKGEKNTKIILKLIRKNSTVYKVSLLRDTLVLNPTIATNMNGIGYIKIHSFSKNTATAVKEDISNLKKQQLIGLIIDLRDNYGGLLDQAIGVIDLFLHNKLILSLVGKNNKETSRFISSGKDIINNLPIIVLINERSASASEIVAGSLQDNKRAIILGSRSFGKGLIQDLIPLKNGEYLKLSTAEYILPSGRKVDNNGITPDVTIYSNGIKCNEPCGESNHQNKSIYAGNDMEKQNKDYQLDYAILLIKKYGKQNG